MSDFFLNFFSRLKLLELLESLPSLGSLRVKKTPVNDSVKNINNQVSSKIPFSEIIKQASEKYGVDESLISAVIKQESSFNPLAVSKCGAQGLMQLMPAIGKALGVVNPFDAEQNIMAGTKYLKQKLDEFGGNVSLALAAYNAGSGAVKKYGGIPPYKETQAYVKKIVQNIDYMA
ncbi:lytic transglycosylase domain-containing protein [Syntrophomonas palmitatica]|uniref:lytic transglycosylase domain-containing protein n=1 Tax=Syntrophomonas palmitatica TaxID=402877 RepID=UPI0006D0FF79|nr:lytic transglycosylase domain-containing protein [Syntrophomonas palmitatica]